MKGVRGKLYMKLKSIKPIGYLKPDRILQVNAAEGYLQSFMTTPNPKVETTQLASEEQEQDKIKEKVGTVQEPDIIDVSELMRDLEEEEEEDDKENVGPTFKENVELPRKPEQPLSEIDVSSFRRPDMNSGTLFDPNLLAAFEEAVNEHIRMTQEERNARIQQENVDKTKEEEEEEQPPHKSRRIQEEDNNINPLLQFEERCPPGGEDSVVFYTTTLRGIRKTFEDCTSVRFLLESFRVTFFERDLSMHMEFKEELWRLLDRKDAVPPRLFIKGRYIGGASEILGLHEQGKFRLLFQGVPIDQSNGPCEGCAGVRFVLCYKCNGSHKVVDDQGSSSKCHQCNENGLIICPICC